MTDADRQVFLLALNNAPSHRNRVIRSIVTNASLQHGFNGSTGNWTGNTTWGNSSLPISEAATVSEPKTYHYWMVVMMLVPMLTIFGNILVVLAVSRERTLQSVTNYFIVSLALADILVAAIVMPVSVYVEVRDGNWDFSNQLCDLWIMCDALFSTASILNLVAISVDRFIAVTQPIKYAKHKNSKRTPFTLAITWLLSIAIALPIGCGLQNMQGLRYHEKFRNVCTFFNGDFLIYSSLGSFYIPCIVMLVLYYRIFGVIRSRAKKAGNAKKLRMAASSARDKQQLKQQESKKQQPQRSTSRNHAPPQVQRPQTLLTTTANNKDCLACQTEGIYTGEQPVPHTCKNSSVNNSSCSPAQAVDSLTESQTMAGGGGPSNSDNSGAQSDGGGGGGDRSGKAKKQQLFQQLKLRKKASSNKAENRSAARREKKATKTLAIVLGVFLFCWMPFFITNLMWAACLKNFNDQESLGVICNYDRRINVIIVWLGYVNSFLNPLIYTIFNTEFRKAFKKLLHIA